MKRKVIAAALLLILAAAGTVTAQTNTAITIGGNYWRAQWNVEGLEAGNMIGPYLNIRSGKLTLGGSLFTGTFKAEDSEDMLVEGLEAKRNDINLSVGYNLGRFFNVFGAYKHTKYTLTGSVPVYDPWLDEWSYEDAEEEFKGAYIGGGASIVFPFQNSPLFAYGSGAFLAAQEEDWADITSVTVGLGFRTQAKVTVMVGFRSDMYSKLEDADESEKIQGLTASLAYTLR
jgi:hypothetical protein